MFLSIIIPVYNEETTIIQILKKVNSQKKKLNLEVIVSNDGSNDKTLELVKENSHLYIDHVNGRRNPKSVIGPDCPRSLTSPPSLPTLLPLVFCVLIFRTLSSVNNAKKSIYGGESGSEWGADIAAAVLGDSHWPLFWHSDLVTGEIVARI